MSTKYRIDEVPWELVSSVNDGQIFHNDRSSSSEEELLQLNESQLSVEYNSMGRRNKKKKTRSPKDSDSEYEVVPAQRIICMDNENLFVKENHFKLDTQISNSSTENDSDIEIITKPLTETMKSKKKTGNQSPPSNRRKNKKQERKEDVKREKGQKTIDCEDLTIIPPANTLYSQILQKNIPEAKGKENIEPTTYSEDFYIDNYAAVNVLSQSFPDIKTSMDIVFSENADGLIEVDADHFGARQKSALEPIEELDEFCFERLFNSDVTSDAGDFDDDDDDVTIVSLKTSTLIMLFCLTVIVSMGLGNGCGSFFIYKPKSPVKNNHVEESAPLDEKYTDILIYSNGNIRKLSISEALLGEKNRDALLGLVESYKDLETRYDDLIKKYTLLHESFKHEKSLSLQLKRDQMKIDAQNNEKTEPSEESELKDSDDTLWNRIRDGWRHQQAKIVKKNQLNSKVKQFRKIFNIGNIVNSKPSRISQQKPPKNYCPDEDFQNFQNRWKNFGINSKEETFHSDELKKSFVGPIPKEKLPDSVIMPPEPAKSKCEKERHGKYKTVYNCDKMRVLEVADEDFPRDHNMEKYRENLPESDSPDCKFCKQFQSDSIVVEIINKKIRIISQLSETDDLSDHTDPFHFVRKSLGHLKVENNTETEKLEETEQQSSERVKENNKMCKKEKFGDYRTLYSCASGKILENKDPGFQVNSKQDGCFACQVDGVFVEVVNNSIRVISEYEGENLTENSNKDPFEDVRQHLKNHTQSEKKVRTEKRKTDLAEEQNDQINWMRKRLAKVELEFDIYKWRVGSKLLEKISDLQFQIAHLLEERKEERLEFKLRKKKFSSKMRTIKQNIITEKEKLDREKENHQIMLEKEKENFQQWKRSEEKRLKYDSKKFDNSIQKRNEKFKLKVKKAKELLKKNLKEKYAKISQMRNEYEKNSKKVQDSIKIYERRNNRLTYQLNSLRKLYKSAEMKLIHYERINDNFLSSSSHDADFTKPENRFQRSDSNDEALRKVVNKYKNKHKECKWRIPMTSCACNQHPGKPIPPSGLRNPSPFTSAGHEIPLRPSPSLKEMESNNTSSSYKSSSKKPWYFYKMDERRLVNSYENDWYDRLMKSRRHSRQDDELKYEGPKMNWFLKYMNERENQRENESENESEKEKPTKNDNRKSSHKKFDFQKTVKEYRANLKKKWDNLMGKLSDKWYHHGNNGFYEGTDSPDFDEDFYEKRSFYDDEDENDDELIMN